MTLQDKIEKVVRDSRQPKFDVLHALSEVMMRVTNWPEPDGPRFESLMCAKVYMDQKYDLEFPILTISRK